MTTHGTIFGHDANQEIRAIRKFGAFAGTTWLRHAKAIAATGQASTEPDFGLNGKTLKVVVGEGGKELQSMVVQVDDMISAVCCVKERTLLAAQMEKEGFEGEMDEVAASFSNDGLDDAESAKVSGIEGDEQQDGEDDVPLEESEPKEAVESKPEDPSAVVSTSPSDAKLSKIRILEIRAETMAKEFAEEICGPDFRMLPEFK